MSHPIDTTTFDDLDEEIARTEARLRALAKAKHAKDNPGVAEWAKAEASYQQDRDQYEETLDAAECCLDRIRAHVRVHGGIVAMATRSWVAHCGYVLARAPNMETANAFANELVGKADGLAVRFEVQPMDFQAGAEKRAKIAKAKAAGKKNSETPAA